jgi:Cu(I)/Ag(I) efflux system membrane fusion protein
MTGDSKFRRRVIVASAGLIVLVGVAWLIVARRGADKAADRAADKAAAGPAPREALSGGAMQGMQGMEGMVGMTGSSGGNVQLTAAQIRQFGITFGAVEQRVLDASVRATGTVALDESRLVRVAPKTGGFAERVYVETTGAPVRAGQPLLELYSPDVLAAQEELLVAARLDRSTGEHVGSDAAGPSLAAAARRRLRLLDVPESQIAEVLRTGRARRTVTLLAPTGGVVLEKLVVQGQSVAPGATLYTIGDLSRVWIEVDVREPDAGALRPGAIANVELSGMPGRRLGGRVEYVYPVLDPGTRAVRARIAVSNTDGALKPGMYATVTLTASSRRTLTVPTSAVINTGARTMVFMDMGGGSLMPMDVQVGRVVGDYSELRSGLNDGDRVVTSSQFLLESESNLGDVMRSMIGQTGSGDMSGASGGDMKGMPGMAMPAPRPAPAGAGTPAPSPRQP